MTYPLLTLVNVHYAGGDSVAAWTVGFEPKNGRHKLTKSPAMAF